jgi:predicted amidohydrolase YtcJ
MARFAKRIPLLAALISLAAAAQASTIIDRISGYTITSKGDLLQFEALAFDDAGKVILAGSRADALAKAAGAKVIDGGGKTLLTGLIDAHGHVMGQGLALVSLDLRNIATLAATQRAIADYARRYPDNAWVRGRGWNQVIWNIGRFPTAAELDAVVRDRPVWLRRIDGHAGWANSKALQLAGVGKDTQDPQGGKIERDENGNPSGVLIDAAMDLVNKIAPPPSDAENRAALDAVMVHLREVGLTSVGDMGISVGDDALFREYADRGKLTTRVYGAIAGAGETFDRLSVNGPLRTYSNDVYALRAVKLYADGALGSRGAALLEPYSDMPGTRGLLFQSNESITAQMEKAMKGGYQVLVHAIGDGGNHQVVDAFAALAGKFPLRDLRNRIEHAQVVALADIPRFKQLGIIASMQPTHATSDMNMAEDRIGHERIKGAYAWRTFLAQGSGIACGSDFPVEKANPFLGLHAAVTRESEQGMPVGGWYANESLSLKEAFRCFTLDAAYAANQDKVLGSLEPGKWADFILIDQDLFRMNEHEIYKVKVLQTWVAGKKVFGN